MGIIGVVAALTIPNLNSSTNEAEKVAKVKKIYANLTEALGRATAVYGPLGTWFTADGVDDYGKRSLRMGERITEFMKISKNCKYDKGCFSEEPLLDIIGDVYFDNYYEAHKDYPAPMYTLADGSSVAFVITYDSYYIYVDIDGPNKGKNRIGYDIFKFAIDSSGLLKPDMPYVNDNNGDDFVGTIDYLAPTLWIIKEGNLDYTKCMNDLTWGTKTTCK